MTAITVDPDQLRLDTKLALTMLAKWKRIGVTTLSLPDSLNGYGFRTESGELFDFKKMKQLMNGEIGATRK